MSKEKYPSMFSPQMEAIVFIIFQIFFARRAVLKIGEYINNSLHLARKYARIFVRGHYLFREENSFPRAKLEENCELRGTDNVQGEFQVRISVQVDKSFSKYLFSTAKTTRFEERALKSVSYTHLTLPTKLEV